MNKEIINLNNSKSMFSKENINKLIVEINKFSISKDMKKMLLIASLNLLSSVKTTKALVYQLQTIKNKGEVALDNSKSRYLHKIMKELNNLTIIEFSNTVDASIKFVNDNNISIKL